MPGQINIIIKNINRRNEAIAELKRIYDIYTIIYNSSDQSLEFLTSFFNAYPRTPTRDIEKEIRIVKQRVREALYNPT